MRQRGTIGHPYSALNLRLIMASFGLISCTVFSIVLAGAGEWLGMTLFAVLAIIAVVDLAVIQHRRHERHRAHPDRSYSLFE
ncbi:MAG: hypothetical protein HOQ05_09025 [Corynebacteriales bacterium]|nr:hypothetical protein [Mycobacteriales bacterium]